MKKNLFLSAAALAGAMTMVSCSSEEEVKPQNGKREEVKTSFTLSVGSVKPGTRMTADAVQQDEKFNGMEQIQLFPFDNDGSTLDGDEEITISPIALADFNGWTSGLENANAKVYNDVTIPVGVDNFVFYGMSMEAGNGALAASYDSKALNSNSTLENNVYFDLVSYNPGKTFAYFNTTEAEGAKDVLAILNDVDTELTTQIAKATPGIVNQLNEVQTALRALEAGSSNSVRLFLEDVYNRLKGIDHADANAVIAKLNEVFDAPGSNTAGYTLDWKTDPDFPGCYNLPDGAVAVKHNGSTFAFVDVTVDGVNFTKVAKYTKPARLAYWVNTAAKTRNSTYFETNQNQPANWGDAVAEYDDDAVSLTTQSVILKDQIQYAVGRLDAQVRITEKTLYDSGSGVPDAADEEPQMVVAPAGGYQLTGVLIGGQKQVDWKFQPQQGAEEYTIYDNVMTKKIYAMVGSTYSDINHTLALETKANEKKRICLEFVNTGKDFFGVGHKLIPAGSKFYLITELEPGSIKEVENPNRKNQVFLQDYITTAKLTIGEKSLQKAYNVVPDLRSPKLELGLSVDLKWEKGITFEQEF